MVTIQTELCEADRLLLQEVKANQERILQLLTSGDPSKNWLKSKQVEDLLHADRSTLWRWRKKGWLVYDEQRRRYREDSVVEIQKKLHIKPAA